MGLKQQSTTAVMVIITVPKILPHNGDLLISCVFYGFQFCIWISVESFSYCRWLYVLEIKFRYSICYPTFCTVGYSCRFFMIAWYFSSNFSPLGLVSFFCVIFFLQITEFFILLLDSCSSPCLILFHIKYVCCSCICKNHSLQFRNSTVWTWVCICAIICFQNFTCSSRYVLLKMVGDKDHQVRHTPSPLSFWWYCDRFCLSSAVFFNRVSEEPKGSVSGI